MLGAATANVRLANPVARPAFGQSRAGVRRQAGSCARAQPAVAASARRLVDRPPLTVGLFPDLSTDGFTPVMVSETRRPQPPPSPIRAIRPQRAASPPPSHPLAVRIQRLKAKNGIPVSVPVPLFQEGTVENEFARDYGRAEVKAQSPVRLMTAREALPRRPRPSHHSADSHNAHSLAHTACHRGHEAATARSADGRDSPYRWDGVWRGKPDYQLWYGRGCGFDPNGADQPPPTGTWMKGKWRSKVLAISALPPQKRVGLHLPPQLRVAIRPLPRRPLALLTTTTDQAAEEEEEEKQELDRLRQQAQAWLQEPEQDPSSPPQQREYDRD